MQADQDAAMPSPETILDRALAFALEGLQAAEVQLERARQEVSSGPGGAFLWWIDLQFFIVALRRLRQAAELALRVPVQRAAMQQAIKAFDEALPDLLLLRNVGEHIDEYAVGDGFDSSVKWQQLQVGGWDGSTFEWLGTALNADRAIEAGKKLVGEIEWAGSNAGAAPGALRR
jgi:hypothetical protein